MNGSQDYRATLAFFGGFTSALRSVFAWVMAGTYLGMGALAHYYGLSPWWLLLSTVLVWAGPAQLILMVVIGTGGSLMGAAIAVWVAGVRLFPMVVTLLPLLRGKGAPIRKLLLPAHLTTQSMWVESQRILPKLPHDQRIAFCNGLALGYMATAVVFGFVGFFLAVRFPPLLAGALLFLTPLSFLLSTARGSQALVDRLALALGLVIGPLLAYWHVGFDLIWTGLAGGTLAYGIHRLRQAVRRTGLAED
jgi:predicted branched-subunit amino acid permease